MECYLFSCSTSHTENNKFLLRGTLGVEVDKENEWGRLRGYEEGSRDDDDDDDDDENKKLGRRNVVASHP